MSLRIIVWVEDLLNQGYAYEVDGNVYFSVEKFRNTQALPTSGRRAAGRGAVEVREDKHHPADFALWKRADPEHILRWPVRGRGLSGWHIEVLG